MNIVTTDEVMALEAGTSPNYNAQNPIWKVIKAVENVKLAANLEYYDVPSLQYLFHFTQLELYGPQGGDPTTDPRQQDNKEDFQKQNIKNFSLGDIYLVRGWVQAGDWRGPFLKISYRGGPDTPLSDATDHQLGEEIRLWCKIGNTSVSELIRVPYNEESDKYEVELWGYSGGNLPELLDEKGRNNLERGHIQLRPDLIKGSASDFQREQISDVTIAQRAPDHLMHPILPLHIELAWANAEGNVWDSNNGNNYHLEFSMIFRGWNNFLKAGVSGNPHGGVGFLEYRNLMSNYFEHKSRNELGRDVAEWNFNAFGSKDHGGRRENFMAVDYMDLHVLRPTCGIGIHRHRDNQEIFFMIEGQGLMIVGDWGKFPGRERGFEVRTMRSGDMALCKTGQLHALFNLTDMDTRLFMFGGYD